MQVLPDCCHVPQVAVARASAWESGEVRTQLQGAVVAVLEESFAINAEELFRLLNGDPPRVLGHDLEVVYSATVQDVKRLSIPLRKFLSLCFCKENVGSN